MYFNGQAIEIVVGQFVWFWIIYLHTFSLPRWENFHFWKPKTVRWTISTFYLSDYKDVDKIKSVYKVTLKQQTGLLLSNMHKIVWEFKSVHLFNIVVTKRVCLNNRFSFCYQQF